MAVLRLTEVEEVVLSVLSRGCSHYSTLQNSKISKENLSTIPKR